jgi:hypothetical protein
MIVSRRTLLAAIVLIWALNVTVSALHAIKAFSLVSAQPATNAFMDESTGVEVPSGSQVWSVFGYDAKATDPLSVGDAAIFEQKPDGSFFFLRMDNSND